MKSDIIRIETRDGDIQGYEIKIYRTLSSISQLIKSDDIESEKECEKLVANHQWRLELEADKELRHYETLIKETRVRHLLRKQIREIKKEKEDGTKIDS